MKNWTVSLAATVALAVLLTFLLPEPLETAHLIPVVGLSALLVFGVRRILAARRGKET